MMSKYILYSHAGSNNHGCEALLRTTASVLETVYKAYSGDVQSDLKYGLDKFVSLHSDKGDFNEGWFRDNLYSIKYKITKNDKIYFKKLYRKFIQEIESDGIYISIGGDNYCYHFSQWLQVLNTEINQKGAKSILWGCSINEDELQDKMVVADLEKYALITARESLTFNLLKSKLHTTVRYVPDTAFLLPVRKKTLPAGFVEGNTIGLNISPVILGNSSNAAKLMDSFVELVEYIIRTTEYQIALIPHVVIPGNDDREALQALYERINEKKRLVKVEDADCMVLKGYISRCNIFIGARTHATIAAYSSKVPTLVIGYSVKSLGIAKDLFGSNRHYVLPVQELKEADELIREFEWIKARQSEIHDHLEKILPEYIAQIDKARTYLEEF